MAQTLAKNWGLRKWLKWLFLVLVILPILGWLCSNLWLVSPWGRDVLAGKLAQRSGLECNVGGAWWTPWGGVSIWGLDLRVDEDEEPMVNLSEVNVQLYWQDLWKKKLNVEKIQVKQPDVVIDLDQVKEFLEKASVFPEGHPELEGQRPSVASHPRSLEVKPSPENSGETTQQQAPSGESEAVMKQQQSQQVTAKAKTSSRPCFIAMQDANFRIVQGGKELLKVEGVNLHVPLGDIETEGSLTVRELSALGQRIGTSMTLPTESQGSLVRIKPQKLHFYGLECNWGATWNLRNRRFHIVMNLPQQSVQYTLENGVRAQIEACVGRAQLAGQLNQIGTWFGEASGVVRAVQVGDGTGQMMFEQGELISLFRNGQWMVPRFNLLSEDLSIMGNGFLESNGFLCGVLRLLGSPESATSLKSRLHPAVAIEEWWADYETPDRKYRDVYFEGELGQWSILEGGQWLTPQQWKDTLFVGSN